MVIEGVSETVSQRIAQDVSWDLQTGITVIGGYESLIIVTRGNMGTQKGEYEGVGTYIERIPVPHPTSRTTLSLKRCALW